MEKKVKIIYQQVFQTLPFFNLLTQKRRNYRYKSGLNYLSKRMSYFFIVNHYEEKTQY